MFAPDRQKKVTKNVPFDGRIDILNRLSRFLLNCNSSEVLRSLGLESNAQRDGDGCVRLRVSSSMVFFLRGWRMCFLTTLCLLLCVTVVYSQLQRVSSCTSLLRLVYESFLKDILAGLWRNMWRNR